MNSALDDCQKLWINVDVATMEPKSEASCGMLKNHAIGVVDGMIKMIAPMHTIDTVAFRGELIDGAGCCMTPGLIDSHTHLVHGGQRSMEFSQRLNGVSYEEIARRGGGILATVKATRALSEDELVEQSRPRLEALLREGVTTVEIKSGYGLTVHDELKMLRAARRLAADYPVRLRTTLLTA